MNMEQLVEWELARKTEVVGEYLPQCHFAHHKSHIICDRTRATAVGSQLLTTWAKSRSNFTFTIINLFSSYAKSFDYLNSNLYWSKFWFPGT
jgi:hypothetical protein